MLLGDMPVLSRARKCLSGFGLPDESLYSVCSNALSGGGTGVGSTGHKTISESERVNTITHHGDEDVRSVS